MLGFPESHCWSPGGACLHADSSTGSTSQAGWAPRAGAIHQIFPFFFGGVWDMK